MKLRTLAISAALVLSAAAVKPALADTTLYQQAPNQVNIFTSNQTVQQIYDNFTLSSTATVTGVTWYGVPRNGAAPSTFNIDFYSDSGGLPGTLLGSDVVPSNGTATGVSLDAVFPEYVYSASLTPLTLEAGAQYWIEITAADTIGNWTWESATGGDSSFEFLVDPDPGFVQSAGFGDPAFTLTGNVSTAATPEPSSFMLLGTGLAGVAGFARRRFLKA